MFAFRELSIKIAKSAGMIYIIPLGHDNRIWTRRKQQQKIFLQMLYYKLNVIA